MGSRKPESKEETHDRSMARLLTILAVLAVVVLATSSGQQLKKDLTRLAEDEGTAEGSHRTKRSRSNSRYNSASGQTNPNRGRKRVRLTDGRPEVEVRTERPAPETVFTQPRNINRGEERFQEPQPTSPPLNFNSGSARFQEVQPTNPPRNFNRGNPRFQEPQPTTRPRPSPGSRNQLTRT